ESLSTLAALRNEAQARLEVARAALEEAKSKALLQIGQNAGNWLYWTPEDVEAAREAQANFDMLSNSIAKLDATAGQALVGNVQEFFKSLVFGRDVADMAIGPLEDFRREVEQAREALEKARQNTAEYRAERAALILTELQA